MNPSHGPLVSTYQTRIADYGDIDRAVGDSALAGCAELYGRVQEETVCRLCRRYLTGVFEERIPAALRDPGSDVQQPAGFRWRGKVSSVRETIVLRRDSLERRITRAEREVDKAVKGGRWAQVHQKRRRLANLRFRLAGLEADVAAGRVRLCFGSKAVVAKAV